MSDQCDMPRIESLKRCVSGTKKKGVGIVDWGMRYNQLHKAMPQTSTPKQEHHYEYLQTHCDAKMFLSWFKPEASQCEMLVVLGDPRKVAGTVFAVLPSLSASNCKLGCSRDT